MLKLTDVVLDCPDTMALARFYAELTGGQVSHDSEPEWATVTGNGVNLAFQRVDDYQAPTWPSQDRPQQFHLDFEVDDLQAEGDRILQLGARHVETHVGPQGNGFVVYLDPDGHPFCLCHSSS
jgi:catechol 2,3-dioxygenase-like lactoylglutathione lyase family enzyme